jgi:hypothetical protein
MEAFCAINTELWNTGILEYWEKAEQVNIDWLYSFKPITPLFHYSIIPVAERNEAKFK